jgi:hypothetical protein
MMRYQFGGEKGKKVKLKTFKTWLQEMDVTSGGKQKLESNFNNWKQSIEQVDDILVIGVKHT